MDLQSYRIDFGNDEDLTIDVAIRGRSAAPTLVLSSGVHGVEGFAGSAIQLAFSDRLSRSAPDADLRYVFIHGVNPFGFAHLRRFNEANVDLNRNFFQVGREPFGRRDGYVRLNGLLNPESPPRRFEPFAARMAIEILREGRAALRDSPVHHGRAGRRDAWRLGFARLKEAVACGQYEFPRGLFFGGKDPGTSTRTVQEHCSDWLGDPPRVRHLDVHTGLGTFGSYRLLLGARTARWKRNWERTFGHGRVESLEARDGVAFPASGSFVDWMENRFPDRIVQSAALEYGTYPPIRVLEALRAENRAHHHCESGDPRLARAKKKLLESFCPRSAEWRRRVVSSGLEVIERAGRELLKPDQ